MSSHYAQYFQYGVAMIVLLCTLFMSVVVLRGFGRGLKERREAREYTPPHSFTPNRQASKTSTLTRSGPVAPSLWPQSSRPDRPSSGSRSSSTSLGQSVASPSAPLVATPPGLLSPSLDSMRFVHSFVVSSAKGEMVHKGLPLIITSWRSI